MEYVPQKSQKKKAGIGKILLIVLGIVLAICLVFFVIGLFVPQEEPAPQEAAKPDAQSAAPAAQAGMGDWTVMFYLCGTDLETKHGMASANLAECAQVELPDNVRLLVCTGGTKQWQQDYMDSDYIEYYRMTGKGDMELLKQLPSASMGDADTLGAFLRYGVENFPAQRYGTILWNHGGGLGGVAFDELYDGDPLSVAEFTEGVSQAGAKLEFMGFDACLMATLEGAMAIAPHANYMIASEESEPGTGWDYIALLSALVAQPDMDGAALGRVVCDSYYAKCEANGGAETCTLSVTDLSKVNALGAAFDDMAAEMTGITGDVARFRELTQDISRAENYGGNTESEGYFNLVDIGDMVLNARNVLSNTGEAALDALFEAVVYNVNGSARANANGLSTFYPIKAETYELDDYAQSAAFSKNYLTYIQASRKDWKAPEDFVGMDFANVQVTAPEATVADADYTVQASTWLGEDGAYHLDIDSGAEYVAGINFTLYQMDYEYNEYMLLGRDDDINVNEDGMGYTDNFRGVWPALEGIFVNLNLIESTDDYNLYSIPVTLNGEVMNLRAIYDWSSQSYALLDAVAGSGGNTFASRVTHELKRGDVVEVLMVGQGWETSDETTYAVGSFTVQDAPVLEELPLTDGDYLYQYEITDVLDETYYSAEVIMECKDGAISVYETEE